MRDECPGGHPFSERKRFPPARFGAGAGKAEYYLGVDHSMIVPDIHDERKPKARRSHGVRPRHDDLDDRNAVSNKSYRDPYLLTGQQATI
jgi:hypothetical protein